MAPDGGLLPHGWVRTGALEEILRQLRRILGEENISLSVMTQNFDLTRGYFGDARQVHLPWTFFPPFLHSAVKLQRPRKDLRGIDIARSKFANALTAMMIGALGIASAQNRLSVAHMAPRPAPWMPVLRAIVLALTARDSLVIYRATWSRRKCWASWESPRSSARTQPGRLEPNPAGICRAQGAPVDAEMGLPHAFFCATAWPDQSILLAGACIAREGPGALADRRA